MFLFVCNNKVSTFVLPIHNNENIQHCDHYYSSHYWIPIVSDGYCVK